jgi:cytochrome c oxidase assembly protein subunit 11
MEPRDGTGSRSNRGLVGRLAVMACAMFAFGFALVPLYDVFCEVTGLGGRTADTAATVVESAVDPDRTVTVEFVAVVNEQAPWEFRPAVTSLEVHPGQLYDTTFFARNLTTRELVGQAVPSVAPGEAARHFKKTECFCFTSQEFAPGEGRDMGLTFMVDPDLPAHVDRLTLSYTFFMNRQVASTR